MKKESEYTSYRPLGTSIAATTIGNPAFYTAIAGTIAFLNPSETARQIASNSSAIKIAGAIIAGVSVAGVLLKAASEHRLQQTLHNLDSEERESTNAVPAQATWVNRVQNSNSMNQTEQSR
jgi:hypothetical protein